MMETENKLDMSLDEISMQRKSEQTENDTSSAGKTKNTKRSDRLAQTNPYSNSPRRQKFEDTAGRKVYVGNISWNVKWQDLKDHMRSAGEVQHADILKSGGRSKGCGIVTYATVEEAKNAIETLTDTNLGGRLIFVREDRKEAPSNKSSNTRVYVGNLSWNIKWQDLKDHMKQAGNVVHADVLEEGNGRSKGCGLVEYSTSEEAQEAIETLNDTELKGRLIFVREDREPDSGSISSIARRAPRGNQGNNYQSQHRSSNNHNSGSGDNRQLYVGNLSWETSWQDLKDYFRSVGEVERTEIASFPDGRSRGFGIVRFANASDAKHAIDQLNGTSFKGRDIEVRVDRKE